MTRVPRGIRAAAWAVPAIVLPSAVWRLNAVIDPNPACDMGRAWEPAYIVGLSVVSFGAALLTLGLVQPWGERLHYRVVTAIASLGVLVVGFVTAFGVLNPIFEWTRPPALRPGCVAPTELEGAWVVYAAYTPLVLWAPLLAIVTVHHYRRRRRDEAGARSVAAVAAVAAVTAREGHLDR